MQRVAAAVQPSAVLASSQLQQASHLFTGASPATVASGVSIGLVLVQLAVCCAHGGTLCARSCAFTIRRQRAHRFCQYTGVPRGRIGFDVSLSAFTYASRAQPTTHRALRRCALPPLSCAACSSAARCCVPPSPPSDSLRRGEGEAFSDCLWRDGSGGSSWGCAPALSHHL